MLYVGRLHHGNETKGYICRMRGAYLAGGTNERTDEQLVDADTSHTNYGDT